MTLTSDENVVDDDDKQRENVNDVLYESPESIKDVKKRSKIMQKRVP